MPSPNTIKLFVENHYYHIYNRGVEKRRIFEDNQDYQKFLYYLKLYLAPPDALHNEYPELRKYFFKNNLSEEIDLLAFCLMPNHFHLLVHQKTKNGITKLMRNLVTAYSMYFNKRHGRIGHLFQGIYKACIVENDEYLLHLSRYIHINPIERGVSLKEFQWSSYLNYLQKVESQWIKPSFILNYFNAKNSSLSYENFVEKYAEDFHRIQGITLEQSGGD